MQLSGAIVENASKMQHLVPRRVSTHVPSARSQHVYSRSSLKSSITQLLRVAGGRQARDRTAAKRAAAGLLRLLEQGTPDRAEVDAALDQLLTASPGQPFRASLLGGGEWLVLYTRGSPQLWKTTFQLGRSVRPGNAAGQEFDVNTRRVINRAEYWGSALYVEASGSFELVDEKDVYLPVRVRARINSGSIGIAGASLALPIAGVGEFDVLWIDQALRVFKSGGAVAVQVQASHLRALGLL